MTKIRYGGYISALKDGIGYSEPCFVQVDSPLKVIPELKKRCFDRYQKSQGFTSHGTSSFDKIVIYGVVEED